MALKILTQAEDMPDGKNKLENYAYAKWKRDPTFRNRAERVLTIFAQFSILWHRYPLV